MEAPDDSEHKVGALQMVVHTEIGEKAALCSGLSCHLPCGLSQVPVASLIDLPRSRTAER